MNFRCSRVHSVLHPGRVTDERRRENLRSRRAFTLLEAVISTVIVAVMLVAALNTVGASRITQHKAALVSRGRMLAESLLAEVLQQSYQDPAQPCVFGPEPGESGLTRDAFNDVDDYQGWSQSPPTAKDGSALPNSTNWRRTVTVEWVDPLDPAQVRGTETGLKRITVVAAFQNVPQATVVALKADN
jgi:type II secretory pathway pseudopilin PulG